MTDIQFWLLAMLVSILAGTALGCAIVLGGTWLDIRVARRRRLKRSHALVDHELGC